MSAKWELVFTNASDFTKESIESKRKRFKTADKMNRNLEKMKLEDLIKEGLDTHRDNIPMQKVLARNDFTYCGIIYLENGDERLAFNKCK